MRMRTWWVVMVAVVALFAASCGDDGGTDAGPDTDDGTVDDGTDGTDGDSGSADDGDGADGSDDTVGDTDDFGDIIGDPDFDLDELPDDIADMVDPIDDIVSVGDCRSEVIGLAFTAPEGWMCRVIDVPTGGMDGFTLFTEGNDLNITIATSMGIDACSLGGICDDPIPLDLHPDFPDAADRPVVGQTNILATHATIPDVELVVTKSSALTDEELQFVRDVLATLVEI